MNKSHTYVECCDRLSLIERTDRINIDGAFVRICREGTGCATEGATA